MDYARSVWRFLWPLCCHLFSVFLGWGIYIFPVYLLIICLLLRYNFIYSRDFFYFVVLHSFSLSPSRRWKINPPVLSEEISSLGTQFWTSDLSSFGTFLGPPSRETLFLLVHVSETPSLFQPSKFLDSLPAKPIPCHSLPFNVSVRSSRPELEDWSSLVYPKMSGPFLEPKIYTTSNYK